MSTSKHNKKRNVGLIFEFFSRFIGDSILENNDVNIKKAKNFLKKYFNPSTEIYKEFKLFKSLYEKTLNSREQALHFISKIKEAASVQSQAKLELEKTNLLKELNVTFNNPNFFDQQIPNYKTFATIQILLNSWRNQNLHESIDNEFELEEKLIEHLLNEKKELSETKTITNYTNDDVNKLVLNLMTKKVNENFGDSLNEEQKKIINCFVFNEIDELKQLLGNIKTASNKLIQEAKIEFSNDEFLIKKLNSINELLNDQYSYEIKLDEDVVSFYLGLVNLKQELTK